jgi:hypothetical protein
VKGFKPQPEWLKQLKARQREKRQLLRQKLLEMPVQPAPPPWEESSYVIGGLVEAGYADDTDLLLVISRSCGVFDCSYGVDDRLVARDEDEGWREDNYDHQKLMVKGIGVLDGQMIRVAGLWGGGLNTMTEDGWRLVKISPDYPLSSIVLCPPRCDLLLGPGSEKCLKIIGDENIMVYGFSQTGKSFIVGTSSDLIIFSRP